MRWLLPVVVLAPPMSQSNLRICPPVSHKFISLWASTADVIAPASRPNADDILMIKLSVHYLVGHRSSDDRYFIRLFPLPRRPQSHVASSSWWMTGSDQLHISISDRNYHHHHQRQRASGRRDGDWDSCPTLGLG